MIHYDFFTTTDYTDFTDWNGHSNSLCNLWLIHLYEFYFVNILFFLAVVAGQDAISHVEVCLHGLVVRDALRVVAFHDAFDDFRRHDGLLLHHLIVADEAEDDIGGNDGETGDLIVGEELVADFDDTFVSHFLGGVVDTDGDRGVQVEQS